MKKFKRTIIEWSILIIAAILVVFLGASSFSKYVMSHSDSIQGVYVDFRLTYIGDSTTAIMYEKDGSDVYAYEGNLPLSIINKKDGEVSKRDLKYTITTPTAEELNQGYVVDAWGTKYPIEQTSEYYDVTILDENGNYPSSDKLLEMTSFEGEVEKTVPLYLLIDRLKVSKLGNSKELTDHETVSIILQTTLPYKTVQIINIKVSNSLIIIDSNVNKYFGFDELEIDINTSRHYDYEENDDVSFSSNRPTKLVFEITNSTMFDKERFLYYLENNYEEYLPGEAEYSKNGYKIENNGTTMYLTLFVPAGSSLRVFLYINKNTSVTVTGYFSVDGVNEHDYTQNIAGISNGKVY